MDNEQERNEHFQGFAKLVAQEIGHEVNAIGDFDVTYGPEEMYLGAISKIIAQRAYDLAYHFIESSYEHKGTFRGEIHQTVKMLPDLTSWPNPPQP